MNPIEAAGVAIDNMLKEGLTPDRFDACNEAETAGFDCTHKDHMLFVNAFLILLSEFDNDNLKGLMLD